MKKFVLGFISAVVLLGLIFLGFLFVRGFFIGGSSGPVTSENLVKDAKDFGSLRIDIFGKGQPLADVEVDLGTIGSGGPAGPMSAIVTDAGGTALFGKVPVGNFDVFFNNYHFPEGYNVPQRVSVEIVKGQMTQKRVDLAPKQ